MKKVFNTQVIVTQIILLLLIGVIVFFHDKKTVQPNYAFLIALLLVELTYIYNFFHTKQKKDHLKAVSDRMLLLLFFLFVWEISTTKLNLMHPVLVPAPEDVFYVFAEQYQVLLEGVFYSLELLLVGFLLGLSLGVTLGLIVGWIPRLRGIFYPMANVLTPIPPVVFAPYLIAIMPTFRSASALVILLGIFWPTFLNMMIRIDSIDYRILESAAVLNLNRRTMILKILFPYVFPSVISGLKVSLTTSVMMLTFAEMMGATKGMGFYIINYTHYANYTNVVAGFIVVGVVVTFLNWLVTKIQMRVVKWR
ncbi:ABC transporter permease [Sinanaerobacter sp. ZZT-01]|uniref:ABC transporter permease n=1 Tax=Sinanaerobacter sp. ZZT-01 TaxID=3111540 RepID=UPI002D799E79|nr:ABC transporter permease subunit [Sinanaerobacter sp. ZZT-01]WRR93315.1 ABC transporter permease subunit [Sinanaerobacter sp. ZZT-01]